MQDAARKSLVWTFNSHSACAFPCGVWNSIESAEIWIQKVKASGVLSADVLDESAYHFNVRLNRLRLTSDRSSAEFQRGYTTAVDHIHDENEVRAG